jgi:hypothetical protein
MKSIKGIFYIAINKDDVITVDKSIGFVKDNNTEVLVNRDDVLISFERACVCLPFIRINVMNAESRCLDLPISENYNISINEYKNKLMVLNNEGCKILETIIDSNRPVIHTTKYRHLEKFEIK